jgi:hypothetical protein
VLLTASVGLGGCALLFEGAALEGAGIGMEAAGVAEASGVVAGGEMAGASLAAADLELSYDLVESAELRVAEGAQRGALTDSFSKLTDSGRVRGSMKLDGRGQIYASNRPLAAINRSTGEIFAGGRRIGYLNSGDSLMYEYLRDGSTQAVARLEGFVAENGVELRPEPGGATSVRILRSDLAVDVIGVRDNFYVVRLPNGETGLLPVAALSGVSIIALSQFERHCAQRDDAAGPWLGVQSQDLSPETAEVLSVPGSQGAYLASVTSGGPADRAGVNPGDVVLRVNGETVAGAADLSRMTQSGSSGDPEELSVWRDGREIAIHAALARREQPGALIRSSGELIRYRSCEEGDGAAILHNPDGDTIVDAYDDSGTLRGDGIPGVVSEEAHQRVAAIAATHGYAFANRIGGSPDVNARQVAWYRTYRAPARSFFSGAPARTFHTAKDGYRWGRQPREDPRRNFDARRADERNWRSRRFEDSRRDMFERRFHEVPRRSAERLLRPTDGWNHRMQRPDRERFIRPGPGWHNRTERLDRERFVRPGSGWHPSREHYGSHRH